MNFEPLDPMATTDATWNVDDLLSQHSQSLLLPDGRFDFFHNLQEDDCSETLGEEYYDWMDEKGYTKEWYYTAPSGSLVGIAFRYGSARLRGNRTTTTQDVVAFIDFLQETVKN